MPIDFQGVPTNFRVPFFFVEFDNRAAVAGVTAIPFTMLAVGQKLAAGTQAVATPVQITDDAQADALFGAGSMLARTCRAVRANDQFDKLVAMAVADDGGGVQAVGSFTFGGTPTEAGTFAGYVGGRRVTVAVTSGQSSSAQATALAAAINADAQCQATAAVDGGNPSKVNVTARHKGLLGNDIDLRHSYYADEKLPAGMTMTIVAMTGGATNPDATALVTAMGDEWYQAIAWPWTDSANLALIKAELADRFGPVRQIDGWAFAGAVGTVGTLSTLGNLHNSPHLVVVEGSYEPTTHWEKIGAVMGQSSASVIADPARPFQTLPLLGILAPLPADKFTLSERNSLLYAGISTTHPDAGGVVRIERLITTYKTNPQSNPDVSYLDLTTMSTLQRLRFDFRNYIQGKYPRHKLADDGTQFAPGQAVITPKIGRAEAIARFRLWEENGWVEGFDAFKASLVVERNQTDQSRLDWYLRPDLINGFIVGGAQIQFLL